MNFDNIKIIANRDYKYQKVCRYLKALKDKSSNYYPKELKNSNSLLSNIECFNVLINNLCENLKYQNYYFVNSFVDFVFDQLWRIEESYFFT